jgi:hypothetical protein
MDKPQVKHIEMVCAKPVADGALCEGAAFVQVLVVEDADLQKKIDARANRKLRGALDKAHKDGEHD